MRATVVSSVCQHMLEDMTFLHADNPLVYMGSRPTEDFCAENLNL